MTAAGRRRPVEVTDQELAAVVAAVELLWPRPVPPAPRRTAEAWRFSGRWWAPPVAARRSRPRRA